MWNFLKRLVIFVALAVVALLVFRTVDVLRGPPLELWHTYVPREPSIAEIDQSDWAGYLATEARLFADVKANVTDKLPPQERTPLNRYFSSSPIYPERFAQDWNRSFEIAPEGLVRGAAVFLHGLTDSPYSLRHFAKLYAAKGFVSIGIRLPGHGLVPGALTNITWPDWMAAVRLAVREARRRAGPGAPIQLVGYSNGAALALMYTLDALDDAKLERPERVVLVSPMVGITPFARYAGLAAIPAMVPAFAQAAWLGIMPEYNPFKYNSFPVNAARQSYLLTQVLQDNIARHAAVMDRMPPVLSFQSVVDETVSTEAIITHLHAQLSPGRSELVLFDLNRNAELASLVNTASDTALERLLPAAPRRFKTTVITNRSASQAQVEARVTEAGQTEVTRQPLDLAYPRSVYSLSHVAMPFPLADGLYGLQPDPLDNFGINLGNIVMRGERDVLTVSLDVLMRMSSNPFLPYMMDRVSQGIPPAP
ncbi:alpha/beta fold hydrolase [Aquabacter sp. CN5-332]|uniref:alpha/beta hydrolase n=1 Tax=Aquabacter sp. CN5-332 TaxID=3156608 RepID=UPI0032B3CD8A